MGAVRLTTRSSGSQGRQPEEPELIILSRLGTQNESFGPYCCVAALLPCCPALLPCCLACCLPCCLAGLLPCCPATQPPSSATQPATHASQLGHPSLPAVASPGREPIQSSPQPAGHPDAPARQKTPFPLRALDPYMPEVGGMRHVDPKTVPAACGVRRADLRGLVQCGTGPLGGVGKLRLGNLR